MLVEVECTEVTKTSLGRQYQCCQYPETQARYHTATVNRQSQAAIVSA